MISYIYQFYELKHKTQEHFFSTTLAGLGSGNKQLQNINGL